MTARRQAIEREIRSLLSAQRGTRRHLATINANGEFAAAGNKSRAELKRRESLIRELRTTLEKNNA